MPVLQCPRCPLRFDLAPMLADHLATDHGATPEQVVGLQPPAAAVGLRPVPDKREETVVRRPSEAAADGDGTGTPAPGS